MEIREASADDGEAIHDLVERSFTQSYSLSPGQIETLLETEFESIGEGGREARVAVDDGEIVGLVVWEVDGDEGTIHWLHVEPMTRERGVGTELFETARDAISDGGGTVRALTLVENSEGRGFFEAFDYVREDQRHREVGGESFAEYVYVPADRASDEGEGEDESVERENVSDIEGSEQADEDAAADVPDDFEVPETVTIDDGETVYVAADEAMAGELGPFFVTFTDESHDEKHSYYCTNCESLATTGDASGRIECETCGNIHDPDEEYDASYL